MSDTKSVLVIDGNVVGDVFQNATEDYVEVTADGTKTWVQVLNELYALIDFTKNYKDSRIETSGGILYRFTMNDGNDYFYTSARLSAATESEYGIRLRSSSSQRVTVTNGTISDNSSDVLTTGSKITFYYGNKTSQVDLTTYANKCMMSNGQTVQEKIASIDLGSFLDLSSLETAIKNKLATMKKGDILTGVFSTTQSFAPFNITGGQSIIIQSRGDNISTIGMIQVWNQLGYMHYGFCSNGTFTWKKPTLT